jgi:hypothetical protein
MTVVAAVVKRVMARQCAEIGLIGAIMTRNVREMYPCDGDGE